MPAHLSKVSDMHVFDVVVLVCAAPLGLIGIGLSLVGLACVYGAIQNEIS